MSNYEERKRRKQQKLEEEKSRDRRNTILSILIIVLVFVLFAGGTILSYRNRLKVKIDELTPSTDYSAYLTREGRIKIDASKYVGKFEPESIRIYTEDTDVTDEEVDFEVKKIAKEPTELLKDPKLTIGILSRVNITYTGTVNGIKDNQWSANAVDYEMGYERLIAGFDEQLLGMHPGDHKQFTLRKGSQETETESTEDNNSMDQEPDEVSFDVTINGIYKEYELIDDLIHDLHHEYDGLDDYSEHIRSELKSEKTRSAILSYLNENYSLDEYPEVYLHHAEELIMTMQASQFMQYKQMYENWGMDFEYESYKDFFVDEGKDYETTLKEAAEKEVAIDILLQYIADEQGFKVTSDEFEKYVDEQGISDEVIEYYGKPYIMKSILADKALEWLSDRVTLEDRPDEAEEAADETVETEDAEMPEEVSEDQASENPARIEEDTAEVQEEGSANETFANSDNNMN